MTLLSTTGLRREFGGLVAVDAVDLSIPKGEVRALIGPNGAGKTTLVGLISGRITPTAGRVSFDGQDVTNLPAHKRIRRGMAYTFQITSVFTGLPVRENLELAARPVLTAPKAVRARVDEVLEQLDLTHLAEAEAGDLSYGHQRLVEIGMGLVQSPKLLILDEPTQGLAEGEIAGFKALIRQLAGQTTILLIEHNMDVVMETADQISVLNFGAILAEGTPEDIRANAQVQEAYLGAEHA